MLKILNGKLKNQNIKINNLNIRPTKIRLRSSIFNILKNSEYINFKQINILDLFAGSGILGIESISIGNTSVTFVDNNSKVLKNIYHNTKKLGINQYCNFIKKDIYKLNYNFFKKLNYIIFADPPYYDQNISSIILQKCYDYKILNNNSIFVLEEHVKSHTTIPKNVYVSTYKVQGNSKITFFKKK